MAASFTTFLKEQLFSGKLPSTTTPLDGRTVIVTGSNVGLGYETSLQLASLNPARVILAVRDLVKGEAAATKIRSKTQHQNVEVWKLDLASIASVKAFAERAEKELERLDILVENAGINTIGWKATEDGWESVLQVNVIATGLLAILLLPLLAKTAERFSSSDFKPHLTIVASEVHAFAAYKEAKVPGSVLAALNTKEHYNSLDRYNVTKLLDLYMTHQISLLPIAQNLVVNCVNPGLCSSELTRDAPAILRWILNSLSRTAGEGAKNITWASTQDTTATPGAYISVCSVKQPSTASSSPEGLKEEKRVWEELVLEWKKAVPGNGFERVF